MVAWWDYYTKISWVETSSWQIDIYKISREQIQLDFDDSKTSTWTYDLLVDDFQNNWTWTIYRWNMTSINNLEQYEIDWTKVVNNESDSIKYQVDIDNDWSLDIESYFNSIPNSENELWSISWYISWNTNAKMAWWKIFIDKNNDGELQENKEKFVVTDNNGYYEFTDLEEWNYDIIEISHKNWDIVYPLSKKYDIILNNWQSIKNLNFENKK